VFASHFQVKALLKYPGGLSHFSVENSTLKKKKYWTKNFEKEEQRGCFTLYVCTFLRFFIYSLWAVFGKRV